MGVQLCAISKGDSRDQIIIFFLFFFLFFFFFSYAKDTSFLIRRTKQNKIKQKKKQKCLSPSKGDWLLN